MAGINRWSSSSSTNAFPSLRSRPRPRRLWSCLHACQYGNPTFWIGVSMFSLVILYVLIVVAVTRVHFVRQNGKLVSNYQDVISNSIQMMDTVATWQMLKNSSVKSLQNRPEGEKNQREEKQLTQRDSYQKNSVKESIGYVQPAVLLSHIESGDSNLNTKNLDQSSNKNILRTVMLQAFLEPPNFDEWEKKPLPVRRKAKANLLERRIYSQVNSCSKLLEQWPVNDDTPTNDDPFLPWIHDVFPTHDGKFIQFVAQNKRRCKTGRNEKDILMAMQPQAALFQHVPVKRVKVGKPARRKDNTTRYRLTSYEEADSDGMTTRFICRFKPSMEETLSLHNFDYDWTTYRKQYRASFSQDDGGIKSIHTTQLLFRCPVPPALQQSVRTGASVVDDWATLFVDLIPIRTPPRYGSPDQFLAPWYSKSNVFDPRKNWGRRHVLPRIEDSGRWENIPVCLPSLMSYEGQTQNEVLAEPASEAKVVSSKALNPAVKKHKLVSCVWASAGYTTRGNRFAVNDGQRRLLEWITHNRLIGFDHFYIYDNTGAFRDDISLKPIADLFPEEITYVPWPAKICNNNPNNVDSPGERSSQYAAEASCRLRFGPHVEWIGQFDIDEYLIPMGQHNSALSLLDKLDKEDTRIVSFNSWRAWPRWSLIDKIEPIHDEELCWSSDPCFDLRIPMNTTMLQAYNCDRQQPGQKSRTMPAEKQIYRADYVLQHFVHYSAATVLSEMNKTEWARQGLGWKVRAFPDQRQRFADEVTEGLMIHSKAVAHQDTVNWEKVCHIDAQYLPKRQRGLCRLGIPWPREFGLNAQNATNEGWAYNCYINEKVENYYVPRLEKAMKERLHFFDIKQ